MKYATRRALLIAKTGFIQSFIILKLSLQGIALFIFIFYMPTPNNSPYSSEDTFLTETYL